MLPYSGSSWDGEYDYEPGGLEDQKTHKILTLSGYVFLGSEFCGNKFLEIEACHVTKTRSDYGSKLVTPEQEAAANEALVKMVEAKIGRITPIRQEAK